MKYLFPCLPNRLSPVNRYFDDLDRDAQWVGEIKKNGWRALIMKKDDKLEIWNRHERLVTEKLDSIRETLFGLPNDTMLDGELIFTRRVKDAPDAFYLFDILFMNGDALYNEPFKKRRGILEIIYKEYLAMNPAIELARQVHIGKKALYYQSIQGDLNEGIVLKNVDAIYPVSDQKCLQNPYWLKVKKVENHVKCGAN